MIEPECRSCRFNMLCLQGTFRDITDRLSICPVCGMHCATFVTYSHPRGSEGLPHHEEVHFRCVLRPLKGHMKGTFHSIYRHTKRDAPWTPWEDISCACKDPAERRHKLSVRLCDDCGPGFMYCAPTVSIYDPGVVEGGIPTPSGHRRDGGRHA